MQTHFGVSLVWCFNCQLSLTTATHALVCSFCAGLEMAIPVQGPSSYTNNQKAKALIDALRWKLRWADSVGCYSDMGEEESTAVPQTQLCQFLSVILTSPATGY